MVRDPDDVSFLAGVKRQLCQQHHWDQDDTIVEFDDQVHPHPLSLTLVL